MVEPRDLGRVLLYERIGRGGMAEVWRGSHKALGIPVAIKILNPDLCADRSAVADFRDEARAQALMHHENIAQVLDFDSIEGEYFIVMELIEGDNLKAHLDKCKRPPVEVALLILTEIARGLQRAHTNTPVIVHRDVKPANIMLTTKGEVKVMDFGVARLADKLIHTVTGHTKGTAAYMSPEQAEGKRVDPRSDIFSLGIVAYELLSGNRPFDGRSYNEIIRKIITTEPPPIQRVNTDVFPELARAVGRMLEKDKERRYQSTAELVRDLERIADQRGLKKSLIGDYVGDPTETRRTLESTWPIGPPPTESLLDRVRAAVLRIASSRQVKAGAFACALLGVGFLAWWSFLRPGVLVVETLPIGAEALVDDAPLRTEQGALFAKLPPGDHTLRVSKSGCTSEVREFRVRPGRRESYRVELVCVGSIEVIIQPTIADVHEVLLDDSTTTLPMDRILRDVPSGEHVVRAEIAGWKAGECRVTVEPGGDVRATIALSPDPSVNSGGTSTPLPPYESPRSMKLVVAPVTISDSARLLFLHELGAAFGPAVRDAAEAVDCTTPLKNALAGRSGVTVLERQNLEPLLSEIALVSRGKLLQADAVVVSEIRSIRVESRDTSVPYIPEKKIEYRTAVVVQLRVLDVPTGVVRASGEHSWLYSEGVRGDGLDGPAYVRNLFRFVADREADQIMGALPTSN